MLVRYRDAIDCRRRVRVVIAGWACWYGTRETRLPDVVCIDVGPGERRQRGKHHYDAFPIRADTADKTVELLTMTTFRAARDVARRLAVAMQVPVGPGLIGSGAATAMLVADLDRPFPAIAWPDPADLQAPAQTAVTVTAAPPGIAIRLPPSLIVSGVDLVAPLLLGAVLSAFCLPMTMVGLNHPPTAADWALFLAPVIIGACLSIAITRRTLRGTIVRADPRDGLRINGTAIAGDAIRAIVLLPGTRTDNGLQIVLDRRDVIIGRSLDPGELRWIRALIIDALRDRR
jgi:hypothetical protein